MVSHGLPSVAEETNQVDNVVEPAEKPKQRTSTAKKILFYIPNRALDVLDIFPARLRVGPGVAVNARATDYLSFHVGRYKSGYVGIPGPRYPDRFRKPYGLEAERGIIFCGINATDDVANEPRFSRTEVDLGLHLGLAGLVFGFDPVEFGDFLAGIVFFDPKGDDIERPRDAEYVARLDEGWQALISEKPRKFDSFSHRLDYIQTNFQAGADLGTRMVDTFMTEDGTLILETPPTRMQVGLYVEVEEDDGVSFGFDADFDMKVDLPNLEDKWQVFVTGRDNDELPGTDPTEREGSLRVGARRNVSRFVDLDTGVKLKWLPEAFVSAQWLRRYVVHDWFMIPRFKGFYETDEGFGQLSSLWSYRWFGGHDRYVVSSAAAGRWTEQTIGWEWEKSFTFGWIKSLIEEERRGGSLVGTEDIVGGIATRLSFFGQVDSQDIMTRYRISFPYRFPVYKRWIVTEIAPDFEWENENSWDLVTTLRVGISLIFWGPGYI